MHRSATFSPCRRYRYHLGRAWSDEASSARTLVWLMLNPSTADAERDDPTIRRCIGFSRAWGYDAMIVVNLFAYRATDPRNLPTRRAMAVGPRNDATILRLSETRIVCCAWGCHGERFDRAAAVVDQLVAARRQLICLGTTRDGSPKHPLFTSAKLRPLPFAAQTP